MKLSSLRLDIPAIDDGDWVEIPQLPGVSIKTRGTLCPGYRRAFDREIGAATRALPKGEELSPEAMERIEAHCLLMECLLDWRGLESDDGAPLPFSKKQAAEFMTDRSYRRFHFAVSFAARAVGMSFKDQTEALAGN